MKIDSNGFVRIAVVSGLPNFVSPNDPLSHKGKHNTKECWALTKLGGFQISSLT